MQEHGEQDKPRFTLASMFQIMTFVALLLGLVGWLLGREVVGRVLFIFCANLTIASFFALLVAACRLLIGWRRSPRSK